MPSCAYSFNLFYYYFLRGGRLVAAKGEGSPVLLFFFVNHLVVGLDEMFLIYVFPCAGLTEMGTSPSAS